MTDHPHTVQLLNNRAQTEQENARIDEMERHLRPLMILFIVVGFYLIGTLL